MPEVAAAPAGEDDLLVGAPQYTTRSNPWLVSTMTTTIIVGAWLIMQSSVLLRVIGIALPLLAFVVMALINVPVTNRLTASYVAELLSKSKLEHSPENVARAARVFRVRKTLSSFQTFACFGAWLVLSLFSIWQFSNLLSYRFDGLRSLVSLVGELAILPICVGLSFLVAAGYAFTDRFEVVSFTPDTGAQASTLALDIEDRNDIDIAGLAVALQAVMRRAEAYTIESTLLSGLSFSAFIGIAFSDKGDIEGYSWLPEAVRSMTCTNTQVFGFNICTYDVYPLFAGHIVFWVAALMLVCSMLFMSAIIVRFQFNEAYRHTEEILAVARVLNDKESNTEQARREPITREITQMLEKGKAGFRDMGPLSSAMRSFRNLGVVSFTLAVAICGMYFHVAIFFALIAIIGCAYCFTHVDNFRRKATFLPQLESVVTSIFHKRI